MVIEITRREVLNNIIRFKDSLLEMEQKEGSSKRPSHRCYKALFNLRTGDMRFARKITNLEAQVSNRSKTKASAADWLEVHLIVEENGKSPSIHFEIKDQHDQAISPSSLEKLAWRILIEMIDVLNKIVEEIDLRSTEENLPEELALKDLSAIHLAQEGARVEDLTGWMGSISRNEAEEILARWAPGSYLIRKADPLLKRISHHLSSENKTDVTPFILTYVGMEGKVSEIFILHTQKGWTQFLDDPNLSEPFYHYYPTPKELIKTFSHSARAPIC